MNYIYITRILCLSTLLFFLGMEVQAQVNIGSLKPPVDAGILQLKEIDPTSPFVDNQTVTTGGLILPRVKLQELKSLAPLLTDEEIAAADYPTQKKLHIGAMVYNTVNDPTKSLFAGVLSWDGEQWLLQKTQPPADFNLTVDISSMDFTSGLTIESITTQTANVSWTPVSGICLASSDAITNGGVGYTPPLQLGGSPFALDVLPDAMAAAEIVTDPFREKVSTLNLTLVKSGAFETKKVTLRQTHYSIQVINWEVGSSTTNDAELGKEYTVRLRSNADWKVETSNDALFDFGTYPQQGVANVTTGTEYKFRLKNDNFNVGETTKLIFKSQINGRCHDVEVNLVAIQEYPNTYMITPGSNFTFSVKKAYKAWEEDPDLIGTMPTGTLTTALVWQDEIGLITAAPTINGTDKNAKISVQTKAGTQGNALIALKINNIIVWTWQLWITDYNPEPAIEHSFPTTASDNLLVTGGTVYSYFNTRMTTVLMDRNIGATTTALDLPTSSGFHYQSGQKNPHPPLARPTEHTGGIENRDSKPLYTTGTNLYTGIKSLNIPEAAPAPNRKYLKDIIMDPSLYLVAYNNNADWYSSIEGEHRSDLWRLADGKKGLYDPCPKGWRVPFADSGTKNPGFGLPAVSTPIGKVHGLDYSAQNYGILPGTGIYFNEPSTNGQLKATYVGISSSSYSTNLQGPMPVAIDVPMIGSQSAGYGSPIRCVRDESVNQ